MRASDEVRKSCSICMHPEEAHHITKVESTTGCRSCTCQRFVPVKVVQVQGDIDPSVKK